ncbi:MAG: 2-dehydropantoate 2-reductase, partial [Rhodospirillales bacterium]|nr:2-dehydropantoate 2-reductase [Rhodospirillales bacterium]
MKICVYGAGAIGGYLAVDMALAGHDVTVIARNKNLAAIRDNGLKLIIGGEERIATNISVTDNPADAGPQDYIFIATKSHQAIDIVDMLQPLLGPDTAVITAQNGVPWWYFYKLPGQDEQRVLESVDPGGIQWSKIGPERAIGCVVFPATELVEPGVIKHLSGDKFTLGEPDGSISERVTKLSEAMIEAGFEAPIRDNIRDDIWKKLWGNLCFNPVSALTHATLDIVTTDEGTREVCRQMMIESKEVAEKLGVNFRIDVETRIDGASKVGAHKTSMLQDLQGGRAME